jgi:hypothetical protein
VCSIYSSNVLVKPWVGLRTGTKYSARLLLDKAESEGMVIMVPCAFGIAKTRFRSHSLQSTHDLGEREDQHKPLRQTSKQQLFMAGSVEK